jgi:hypothetical protein
MSVRPPASGLPPIIRPFQNLLFCQSQRRINMVDAAMFEQELRQ